MKNIWDDINKASVIQRDLDDYSTTALLKDYMLHTHTLSVEDRETTIQYSIEGIGDAQDTLHKLTVLFGTPATKNECGNYLSFKFAFPEGFLGVGFINKSTNTKINLEAVSTSSVLMDKIKEICSTWIVETNESDRVFALTTSREGIKITSLGQIDAPLVPENYSSETITAYNHICTCLSSKTPCGRLILLQGAPGTGKSFMLKSLISSIDSTFVVIGANQIGNLSGPQLLTTFLNQHEANNKPITFILEDADDALTRRDKSNMSKLSDLLNLGDGLIGELLDIRVIATTNAKTIDLDPAILRPGRMCKHIKIDQLNVKDAIAIYNRLVEKPTFEIKNSMTLAEVYRLARKDGWVPSVMTKSPGVYI